jgi:hypothetical protein
LTRYDFRQFARQPDMLEGVYLEGGDLKHDLLERH